MDYPSIVIIETTNDKDVSEVFKRKLSGITFSENLYNEADSINLMLSNPENDPDFWADTFFEDRKLNFQVIIKDLSLGVFNIDQIEFEESATNGKMITLQGLSAPVQSEKSIYTKVRKVYTLKSFEQILKEIANIAGIELSYFFSDFKTKIQVQDEYIANTFKRLAEKYGAYTKFLNTPSGSLIVFHGKKELADYARDTKESAIAEELGRRQGIITIDKNDKNTLQDISSINLKLVSSRKELKIVSYDPTKKRTYRKLAKNKFKLLLEDSIKDFEIVKVASKEEADIIARKVEDESCVKGSIYSRLNLNFFSGNIIEIKNYGTIRDGLYIITESNHDIGVNGNFTNILIEKLPD